jgi:exopolyphosphatase/guanosine-5'-triphosphate,3'-diphosphate pyrophosphatase
MRQAVLDVGSNTAHLLVVDAHRGAAPLPTYSHKEALRLAERIDETGAIANAGIEALITFIESALIVAEDQGCESVMAFATSAIRDATNSDDLLVRVAAETGVDLEVLPGGDEARLTFLAVRRWFGWSSGRLAVFDIGGGSLEVAAGADEAPEVAQSFPLGAGRLTREWLKGDPPDDHQIKALRRFVRAEIAKQAGALLRGGAPDHAVATSKTFRSLARICGAAASGDGPLVRRTLAHTDLVAALPKLATMTAGQRAGLPGVSPARAHQLLAGGIVADAAMDLFQVDELDVCPWALREGVILEKLDQM